MLFIDVLEDENLKDVIDKIISGLLPHENFNGEYFGAIFDEVKTLIHLDEFYGEYFVLLNSLQKIREVGIGIEHYTPKLKQDNLDTILRTNIDILVRKDEVRIKDILEMEGMNVNLSIDKNMTDAASLLYRRTMELYSYLMDMAIPSDESLAYVPALRDVFVTHVAEQSLVVQQEILTNGFKVGRKFLKGSDDWMAYSVETITEIKSRLLGEGEDTLFLDSMEKMEKLNASNGNLEPLANYGIPPLDMDMPMVRHRFMVIAADPGVGKTQIAINSAINLAMAGKRIMFMTGENEYYMTKNALLSNYIYQKYGKMISPKMMFFPKKLPPDMQKLIALAEVEIIKSKVLILRKAFYYETVYDELASLYEKYKFDAVFIDHSGTLRSNSRVMGSPTTLYDALATGLRDFKNDFPCFVMCLSHLDSESRKALMAGKPLPINVTKWSSLLSGESDEIHVLYDNKDLRRRHLLAVINVKRRLAEPITEVMYLRTLFNVGSFEWDESEQNGGTIADLDTKGVIDSVNLEEDEELEEALVDYEDV